MTSLMWFRRDLRLADNPAFVAAAGRGPVVPVFVVDPHLTGASGDARLAFLARCLQTLDESLADRMVLRTGDPTEAITRLAQESGASAVFATADFGPYGRDRDAAVAARLSALGIEFELVESPYAVPPGSITKADGTPYRVFTPYFRAWQEPARAMPCPEPSALVMSGGIESEPLPHAPAVSALLPEPGERAALQRLADLAGGELDGYAVERDRPDLDRTSKLSPYLKLGCIHPRQILAVLGNAPGHEAFRRQLAWRDFYADVLFHRPDSRTSSLQARLGRIRTDHDARADDRFARWAAGRTGYPIVDAGMRQLASTAWMHNRVRMLAASFLVKDLHLDWRRGARHFMQCLVDGDLASNAHGWQWVAGTGTDAAPYHRIFNPVVQGTRFDPHGDYVRRWVPELAGIDGPAVHEPWKLPGAARGYPPPIVDHAAERREALARYSEARSTLGTDDRY